MVALRKNLHYTDSFYKNIRLIIKIDQEDYMEIEKDIDDIFEQYAEFVYRYIFLLVRNKEIAEDLTQETFIKVFQHVHQFNHQSNLNTWIIKIAKNTTYDYFRKIKWTTLFTNNNIQTDSIITPSTEEKVMKKNEIETLYIALRQLKRDYQEVLILRKINEFSTRDTALILGWSENKVKTKLARALKKLSVEMTKQEEGFYGQTKRV